MAKWLDPNADERKHIKLVGFIRRKVARDADLIALREQTALIQLSPTLSVQDNNLRSAGASKLHLLRFLAAGLDIALENDTALTRQECYQQTLTVCVQKNKNKTIQAAALVATPFVFLGGMTTLGVAMLVSGAALIEPEAGYVGVEMAREAWEAVKKIAEPSFIGAGVTTLTAWKSWDTFIEPNTTLEDSLRETDPSMIESRWENGVSKAALFEKLATIKAPERFLIEHLTGFELREFLMGDNQSRENILTDSPVSVGAELRYLLAANPKNALGITRVIVGVINLAERRFSSKPLATARSPFGDLLGQHRGQIRAEAPRGEAVSKPST